MGAAYKGKFKEDQLEQAIITLFQKEGYDYTYGPDIHRHYDESLLKDDLQKYLHEQYGQEQLSEVEMQKIINQIELIPSAPLYEANRQAFWLVVEGFDLPREQMQKGSLHINFIDFAHPERNIFRVVNQFIISGSEGKRPDLMVFINGIPIAICEFKTAIEEQTTIYDAWQQITIRYTQTIPNLLKYCFLSIISDGANTRMGSIFTPYRFYYAWNKVDEEEKVSKGISSLLTLIKGAFAKERVLKILRNYIYYPDNSTKKEVIVCRYPQFFAAEKMYAHIKKHMKPGGDGKGGTYFGATGCGKTYTMLFLSRLLILRDPETFHNPTIILIEDREDLDTQTAELFETAKKFLHTTDIRSIETREDLKQTLGEKPSGGVYVTTIQKFCESIGLLSERSNIICLSDEAHRTQTNTGASLKQTEDGVYTSYGFGKYLRDSFPNATYCGFTGTPIDATLAVFGEIVDRYTMKQSSDDGITVRISYEPRLARVLVSDQEAKEIQEYYDQCLSAGSTPEQVEESKKAMSSMNEILGLPERIKKLAADIAAHYETLCREKPNVVQKAMIVCSSRENALLLLREIEKIRPDWAVPRMAENEDRLTKEQKSKLVALPKINMVATQGKNDPQELKDVCGNKEYRKMLEKQFKNDDSNFRIAIVVDMWLTGFDVPSLAVMYIDKPLQKHTLIQTISRVNRVYPGKNRGLVVDYIGFKKEMLEAVKSYGGDQSPVDELKVTLEIFRNHLDLIEKLLCNFDASRFFHGDPYERLLCLNDAVEYVQTSKEREDRFMGLSRRLKSAYEICCPSGELTEEEMAKAQFYLAIRSIIYKQTNGNAPDTATMNQHVQKMVEKALSCSGVEDIVASQPSMDLFSPQFQAELDQIKLPISKFNALLKLISRAIRNYSHTNRIKAIEFDQRLKEVVKEYNTRDNLIFTGKVVSDFMDGLTDKLMDILKDLKTDQESFKKLGITFEEKVFFDILTKVRDENHFEYDDKKCIALAKKIKKLVDDKSQYADWASREDIKSQLQLDLTVLLYENGYPPEWDDEVFKKVMEQAENYKKYA